MAPVSSRPSPAYGFLPPPELAPVAQGEWPPVGAHLPSSPDASASYQPWGPNCAFLEHGKEK
jgi:hypothetical protein